MDFANERYVKVFVRDTLTWKLLGWEGRSVLLMMMRKLDRAGCLDVGDDDPAEAVAAIVDMPLEVVRPGLSRLFEREVFRVGNGILVMPKFVEGQETPQSDQQRKRESRARRRELAMVTKRPDLGTNRDPGETKRPATETKRPEVGTERDATGTNRDEMSRAVTSGHVRSPLAEPSLAEQSREPGSASPSPRAESETKAPPRTRSSRARAIAAAVPNPAPPEPRPSDVADVEPVAAHGEESGFHPTKNGSGEEHGTGEEPELAAERRVIAEAQRRLEARRGQLAAHDAGGDAGAPTNRAGRIAKEILDRVRVKIDVPRRATPEWVAKVLWPAHCNGTPLFAEGHGPYLERDLNARIDEHPDPGDWIRFVEMRKQQPALYEVPLGALVHDEETFLNVLHQRYRDD